MTVLKLPTTPIGNRPRGDTANSRTSSGGVLVSPRPVPMLSSMDGATIRSATKPKAMNDEVDAILKGLQLDRNFFMRNLRTEVSANMADAPQSQPSLLDMSKESGVVDPPSGSSSPCGSMKSKRNRQGVSRALLAPTVHHHSDFDIYLNEALMPLLGQALDSLCRQLNRMNEQGGQLDPKVRARFNPLTWIAQQLLRGHPKCARTPRRQEIFKNFSHWADQERGRRELLRRKDVAKQVFDGFVLRGKVQVTTIPAVITSLDHTLRLNGALEGSGPIKLMLQTATQGSLNKLGKVGKMAFFTGETWTFDQFWHHFSAAVMAHDVLPYSILHKGALALQQEALERVALRDAQAKEVEAQAKFEAEQEQRNVEYVTLYASLMEDEYIKAILEDGKILTGDDVRPGDAGYEFEVPPKGPHVMLMKQFLLLLGLDVNEEVLSGEDDDGPPEEEDDWWDSTKADAWVVMQHIHQAELCDGVVEKDLLSQVLVSPEGFGMLWSKVDDALAMFDADMKFSRHGKQIARTEESVTEKALLHKKPSMEELCKRLNVSMPRMQWLHRLFESYLGTDGEGQPHTCKYPERPAAILKAHMKELMTEVNPQLSLAEFEARFNRIDEDSSGQIEFDEFVTWVREDEIRVVGARGTKMPIVDLAQVHNIPIALVEYLKEEFAAHLPEGVQDDYPESPASMGRADMRLLVAELTPAVQDEEFEMIIDGINVMNKDSFDFDEFLEVIVIEELPPELLAEFGVSDV